MPHLLFFPLKGRTARAIATRPFFFPPAPSPEFPPFTLRRFSFLFNGETVSLDREIPLVGGGPTTNPLFPEPRGLGDHRFSFRMYSPGPFPLGVQAPLSSSRRAPFSLPPNPCHCLSINAEHLWSKTAPFFVFNKVFLPPFKIV